MSNDTTGGRRSLRGRVEEIAEDRAKLGGWHPVEWSCELVGTAFQLFFAFVWVATLESPDSPLQQNLPWPPIRLALIGLVIGLLAAIVAVTPIGKRSGAHLNPAVTAGFWARGQTHIHDLIGYIVAQCIGAIIAAALFVRVMGSWAETAGYAKTEPRPGLSEVAACGIEIVITFIMVITIFLMLSAKKTARWTPLAITIVLAILIPVGGPPTGASMSPARTLGPDVATGSYVALWVYIAGPLAGAILAALAFPVLFAGRRVLTGTLFHDPRYRTTHATFVPKV